MIAVSERIKVMGGCRLGPVRRITIGRAPGPELQAVRGPGAHPAE